MSHSRRCHKVYPKTPVLRAPVDDSNLSNKLSLFDDVDNNDSQLDKHHSVAQLQEQDLLDDSAESSWEVYVEWVCTIWIL